MRHSSLFSRLRKSGARPRDHAREFAIRYRATEARDSLPVWRILVVREIWIMLNRILGILGCAREKFAPPSLAPLNILTAHFLAKFRLGRPKTAPKMSQTIAPHTTNEKKPTPNATQRKEQPKLPRSQNDQKTNTGREPTRRTNETAANADRSKETPNANQL